jgi:dihydrofolate reductase
MSQIKLIVALDDRRGIAIGQKLPWHLPTDQKYFQNKLKEGPVVMGWNTFAANGFKPYGHGSNTVITRRDTESIPGVWVVHDADAYFQNVKEDIWVVGGGQIFATAIPYATHLYITKVEGEYGANIFFPEYEHDFTLISEEPEQTENAIRFKFQVWERRRN